ncbi:uncharacterized protein si:ch1073-357b18.4 isoform X2 [Clupea harengus]|uniref:Uncharacterized protein si:ch1073-357b18.4 isoform X2 n=1 Tax=Clupea harengus TaxID=7950 RepID=A0A6P3W6Z5_CLUHA|nr:uncharacterized protein si:ch1073-357b18.4 isoform X2 [Clupea harengus]
MDVKPKAEPFADDCVVALSGAYCSEGTDPQSDQAADPTPIMLYFTSKESSKVPLAALTNGATGSQDVIPGVACPMGVRGPSEAVSSSSEFTHDAIMLLIEAMAARWDLYGQRERSRLFQSVQQELEGHGYPLPVERIRRKWNNLIVTYKRVKERCRGRGQARTSWEYYEVMDAVLGKTEIAQGSSASATLLGLATTAQAAALCDVRPPAGISTAVPSCLFSSNIIASATQVPTLTPQRATPPPPTLTPTPPLCPSPLNTPLSISDSSTLSPPRPKMTFVPSSRRKSRRAPSMGVPTFLSQPQGQAERRGTMLRGYLSAQEQRALLDEQRQCRQEARERRRERTANRVAEAVGRMATALELISSKQDTIIALLQRLADKH